MRKQNQSPRVIQPKSAPSPQKQPIAPAVYRPQPNPKVLQGKTAAQQPSAVLQPKTAPTAPPVYRPQSVPKVLQTKKTGAQQPSAGQSPRQPVAPPIYRPQSLPKVLQTKKNISLKPCNAAEKRKMPSASFSPSLPPTSSKPVQAKISSKINRQPAKYPTPKTIVLPMKPSYRYPASSPMGRKAMWVTDGKPGDFPSVLGLTSSANMEQYTFPEVEFVATSGGFTLKLTKSHDAAHHSISIPQGDHFIDFVILEKGTQPQQNTKLMEKCKSGLNFTGEVVPSTDVYTIFYRINDPAYRQIKAFEQEHLDDFAHAYTISLKAVEDEVNKIASSQTDFPTKLDAIKALVKGLPNQLVPQDPMDLSQWTSRLKTVLTELMDISKERDRSKRHSTMTKELSYQETPKQKVVVITLNVPMPPPLPANQLIQLSKISTVFSGVISEPVQLNTGKDVQVKLKEKFNTYFYRAPRDSKGVFGEDVPANTKLTISTAEVANKVWVKVEKADLPEDLGSLFEYYKLTEAYFEVPVARLAAWL